MSSELKLKIGFVLDTSLDPQDGVQQYVIGLGEWLRSQGHDVHYLVGETKHRNLPNVHSLARNFAVTFNGNKTTIPLPTSRHKLRSFIEINKFDILHVQTPHHPLMSQRLIMAAQNKTVVLGTFHVLPYGWLARYATKALGIWLRPSLKRFDKMLAVSKTAAEFEQWAFGLPAHVLPNVVDFNRFHTAQPLDKLNDDVLTILFLGRLVPRKGCQTLLESIALLSKQPGLPKFRVVVCGKGQLESDLKAHAKKSGIENLVEFTGFVTEEDKPRYYASSDISVFPSSAGESFGIVLLEAMASGKAAVLAGDNPGYRTVMEPKTEQLFLATDAAELAERLEDLLTNKAKRDEMAGWGATYTADFDVNVVGAKLVDIYTDLYRQRNMQ